MVSSAARFASLGDVYHSFWRWRREGIWQRINDTLRGDVRVLAGPQPPTQCSYY